MFNFEAEKQAFNLRSTVIEHKRFCEARDAIENLYQRTKLYGEPGSIAVCAFSGGGKSTLIREMGRKYPPADMDTYMELPMLFAEIPASPSISSVAQALIDPLDGHYAPNATIGSLTETLVILIQQRHTKVLVIDEFQHLLERGSKIKAMEVADWFKGLMNRARVSLAIIGLPYISRLFAANTQLRRRTQETYYLNDWRLTRKEDVIEFRSAIKSFADSVEYTCDRSIFGKGHVVNMIYFASNGVIGHVATLLSETFLCVIEAGKKKIEIGDLERAFRKKIWPDAPANRNPFCKSFDEQALIMPGDPFAEETY